MGSPDDDINTDKRDVDTAPNERDSEWEAACLKGWHGLPWEDRIGEPPEQGGEPWYYWVVIAVFMTALLLPLFVELCGFFDDALILSIHIDY